MKIIIKDHYFNVKTYVEGLQSFHDALKNVWSNKIKTFLFPIQRDPDRGITLDVAQKDVSHFLTMTVLSPISALRVGVVIMKGFQCHSEKQISL